MISKIYIWAICLSLIVLVGCGGGGTTPITQSTTGGGNPPPPPGDSSTRLRDFQPGDYWRWEGTGERVLTGGGRSPITVVLTERFALDTISGTQYMRSTQTKTTTFQAIAQTTTLITETWFRQGQGSRYYPAYRRVNNSTLHPVTTATFAHPRDYAADLRVTGSVIYAGTAEGHDFLVRGLESVTVPVGAFSAWKVSSTMSIPGTVTDYSTYWMVPGISNWVAQDFMTLHSGATFRGRLTLRETNVRLP